MCPASAPTATGSPRTATCGRKRRARWSPPTAPCAGCRLTTRACRRSTPASSRSRTAKPRERAMRREGSPWQGLGAVVLKELADHLSSARMRVLEWLVVLTAFAALYVAIDTIRQTTAEDP